MSFARPELLWLAVVLPLLVAAGVYGYVRRRRRAAERLGDPALVRRLGLDAPERFETGRLVLLALAAAALGVAAAGPRWGTEVVESRSRSLNAVFALDVSKSMLASDLEPTRLERERLLARRLLRELPGDRVGLVAFSGRAYVLSPLTVDHSALQLYLDALDPEIVSQGGSSLAAALRQSTDLATGEEDTATGADRTVVLITDGEALEDRDAVLEAADRAARLGVVVHTVGVATTEGAPVPDLDPHTGQVSGYTRDPRTDEVVISRLGDELLRTIAERTGGRYVRLDEAGATDRVVAALEGMERAESEGGKAVNAKERFGWFVAVALALLALDAVWARRRELISQEA